MKKLFTSAILLTMGFSLMAQVSIDNPFFEKVPFRGAFGNTNWTEGWANWDPQNTLYPAPTITVPGGEITQNTTWTKNNVYLLDGWIYVVNGVTLTIEPGTLIRGSKANKGALIVEPGAKIVARGTKDEPIVFTSNEAPGERTYGDWGGLVVCGRAKVNKDNPQIEGGPRTTFGGNDDTDSSGILSYIRIEFPGIAFQPDKEINGLTLGGVGSKTQVDHIQVSFSGDDSFEWFGGTVNAKYLIAYKGWDDDFDTDYGFRGMVQFGVSLRDPQIADPQSKSNSFESDNDGSGSAATPFTNAILSNISSFGPLATSSTPVSGNYLRAMHLRRNTKLQVFNSVFAGWPTGLFIEGPSIQNAKNDELKVYHTIMAGMTNFFGVKAGEDWPDVADEAAWYFAAARANDTIHSNENLKLNNPFAQNTVPDFLPMDNSPLLKNSYWYVPVTSVNVRSEGNVNEIMNNGTLQMYADIVPANASYHDVIWRVDKENVATINSTGLLTALANGDVVVKAVAKYDTAVFGTKTITVLSTGIRNVPASRIECYPNPASEFLTLKMEQGITQIQIANVLGQVVQNFKVAGDTQVTLDIKNLTNGLYIISVSTLDNQKTVSKFMKK